jgi:hypothetical protein
VLIFNYKQPKRDVMKYFCKLLLIVTILLTGISASASQYVDGITFLNLSFDSKVKMIKEAQIMASKMEQLQNTATKKKKYYSYLNFLSNLLINSANADHINKKNLCIYAGWLSMIVKGKCTHPLNIVDSKDLNQEDNELLSKITSNLFSGGKLINKKDYKDHANCGGTDQILCSPDLFGIDPNSKGGDKPFCVKEGNQNPYNASFACLKKVQDLKPEQQKTVYEGIVKRVTKSELEGNGESNLIQMFKLYYDVCMCKGGNNYINPKYAEDMFSSRTCYAWLKQTENIMNQFNPSTTTCNAPFEPYTGPENKHYNIGQWLNKAHDNIRNAVLKTSETADKVFIVTEASPEELERQDQAWAIMRKNALEKNKTCPITIEPVQPINPIDEDDQKKSKILCKIEQLKVDKDKPNLYSFKLSLKPDNGLNEDQLEEKVGENNQNVKVEWGNAKEEENDPFTAKLVQAADATDKVETITASVTVDGEKIPECSFPVTYPKEDPVDPSKSGEYKITATLESQEGEDAVLVAKVTKGDKDVTEELGAKITWKIKENDDSEDEDESEDESEDEDEKDDKVQNALAIDDDGTDVPEGFKKLDSGAKVETKKTENTQEAVAELVLEGQKPISDKVTIPALAAKEVKEERKLQNTGPKLNPGPPPPVPVGFGNNRGFRNTK